MKCPNCQTENPEGIRFCGKCGQPLKLELVCPQCGHANPPGNEFCYDCDHSLVEIPPPSVAPPSPEHTSFAGGRYQIKRFLGEGSKKKVYLAHDTLLDWDIAFALLKTEQLDDAARTRITGEAQVMGRLGSYQKAVTVFDLRGARGAALHSDRIRPGGARRPAIHSGRVDGRGGATLRA